MGKPYYFVLLSFVCNTIIVSSHAQEIFTWSRETGYCNPSVVGLPRAKAVIIKYELQPAYKIISTGKQGTYGNSEAETKSNQRWDFRFRFPILNKPSLTIAAGIKYTQEEFNFRNIKANTYEFYKELEDRPLKSLGLHFYALKPTKNNKYFILRASFDLNGDYNSNQFSVKDFLKFSITPLVGWKRSENLSYAVGLSYGYTFGKPLIFPVVSINKNFNCNLGIESVLPVNIKLRYTKNDKNYFYTGFDLNGASYRLNNAGTSFSEYNKLHLFRSELRYTLNYEREIHDWLWFGIEGGIRHSFNFNLNNGPRARSNVIISNKVRDAPLINTSIFVVPPRGMLKRRTG